MGKGKCYCKKCKNKEFKKYISKTCTENSYTGMNRTVGDPCCLYPFAGTNLSVCDNDSGTSLTCWNTANNSQAGCNDVNGGCTCQTDELCFGDIVATNVVNIGGSCRCDGQCKTSTITGKQACGRLPTPSNSFPDPICCPSGNYGLLGFYDYCVVNPNEYCLHDVQCEYGKCTNNTCPFPSD